MFSKDQWFMVGPLTVLSVLRTMVRIRTHVGGAIQKMVGYQQRGPRVGFSQLNYIGFEIGNNWIETPTVCHVFYGDSVILLWVGYCFGEIQILTHTFSCFIPKIS